MSLLYSAIDSMAGFSNEKKSSRARAYEIISSPEEAEKFDTDLENKVKESKGLSKWFNTIDTIGDMVVDYAKGNYKEVPLNTIVGAVAALVYFLSPVDLLPDVIPVGGQVDDIAVLGFAIKSLGYDIEKYEQWKKDKEIN